MHYGRNFKIKGLNNLSMFEFHIVLCLLLLKSGDVETNPGPFSESSDSFSDLNHTASENQILNNFSIVHYNVQSLANKTAIIESEFKQFDIITVTETWLNERISDNEVQFNDYSIYRRDRTGDSHGGICTFIRNNVYSKRRTDIELPNIECLWVEFYIHNRKILLGTFYRPPNSLPAVLDSMENSIGLAFDSNAHEIIITGDFNLDMLETTTYRKVLDICQHYNLTQLISEPTHFTENSSSIIDLFFMSREDSVLLSGVGEPILDLNIRYHCPIYCVLNLNKHKSTTFTRHIWLYDRGDYASFANELSDTNWNLLKNNDINTYANNITDHIIKVSEKFIPNKVIKVRQSDPNWLTNSIKKMMRKRKRLYDKYKRTKTVTDFENYKHYRNHVTNAVRKSKKIQTDKIAEKLNSNELGPKDWWKTLKQFIKPWSNSVIPPLSKEDIIYSEEKEKVEILNEHFSRQNSPDDTTATLPNIVHDNESTLDTLNFTPIEVENVLKSLKTGKATGPDHINNRILKELSRPLSSPLCELFNFSVSSGKVPDIWKQANITPIFKKDDASDPSNYRPFSLLSCIEKVLEKLVHKYVFNFIRDNAVITAMQSGFMPGDSTVNQLVDVYNTFCKALDEGKEVRAIFCDISKAFDRVWHEGLLFIYLFIYLFIFYCKVKHI